VGAEKQGVWLCQQDVEEHLVCFCPQAAVGLTDTLVPLLLAGRGRFSVEATAGVPSKKHSRAQGDCASRRWPPHARARVWGEGCVSCGVSETRNVFPTTRPPVRAHTSPSAALPLPASAHRVSSLPRSPQRLAPMERR
jgi:hypothetical protein